MTYIWIGMAFGLSQFGQYFVFAAMFYGAGKLMEADPSIKMDDIMIALFCIMFGSSQAGAAAAYGPDMAKATDAAKRIFGITESESEINAMTMDKDATKKRLDINEVKGKIEFKNVWLNQDNLLLLSEKVDVERVLSSTS
jgi:ABC-type multidrug transport system fused ATPase/permease subunit